MKKACYAIFLHLFCVWMTMAATVNITGTVSKNGGAPLKDVAITLAKVPELTAKTDSDGKFTLATPTKTFDMSISKGAMLFELKGRDLIVNSIAGKVNGTVSVYSGTGRRLASMEISSSTSSPRKLMLPSFAQGLNILRITLNHKTFNYPIIQIGDNLYLKKSSTEVRNKLKVAAEESDLVEDTLVARKEGYTDKKIPIDSYNLSDIKILMDTIITQVVCDETTLKDAGKCGNREILVGVAVSPSRLNDLVAREFNYVTAENEMKWQSIQGSEGSFNFSQADNIVNWANQRGIKVKGHCLVWHSQLAGWVEQAKGRDRVLGIMRKHIETVMGHFGNKVYAWDVVNEAIETDSDVGSGNARMRNTVFYREIGPDYIEEAFKIAREYADNHNMKDMKLYYNDYSIDADNDKSRYARTVIKGWVDKKVPVDGIGFQMHIGPPNNIPTAKDVQDNMQYYADLGLEVLISEWDINLCGNRVSQQEQLQLYYDITKICVNIPKCVAITFWGVNDSESWLNSWSTAMCNGGNSQSLLFNNNQKKQTYYKVLDALNGK